MSLESLPIGHALGLSAASLLYVVGGLRFRRWAIEDRPGIPRYPRQVETVMLWLVYSGLVAFTIVVIKQTLRQL